MHLNVPSLPHIHHQVDFDWRFFPFLEFMALRMTTSYGFQTAQMSEKSPQNSSLNLTLTQHPRYENPKPWDMCPCFKVEPLKLGIIAFIQTLVLWWFCCKSTLLLMMNMKLFAKVFTKLKTHSSLHGLQFSMLDIIVGCTI